MHSSSAAHVISFTVHEPWVNREDSRRGYQEALLCRTKWGALSEVVLTRPSYCMLYYSACSTTPQDSSHKYNSVLRRNVFPRMLYIVVWGQLGEKR